ncbi:SseB family protein [Flavobacterium sp. '19STA2R22 D10 B1']|uniref:SseB family protein n=1 Tax=Flavobacterium aerium TaxID=3037261 RepID=UPI00278C5A09|nr:SseB family protein [Flavobacterium sp. '19STA2R22 D10 B1']
MKFIYLILFTTLISCNNQKNEIVTNEIEPEVENTEQNNEVFNTEQNDKVFLGKVVIILSEELKGKEKLINIQDYVENGKSFIPIFSSIEKFNESTQGKVTNEIVEVDGIFLLSILDGTETLKLNPGLKDEIVFNSEKLKEKYSENITKIKAKMENIKNRQK